MRYVQSKCWQFVFAYSLALFSTITSGATFTIQGSCGGLPGGVWDGAKCILNSDLVITSIDSVLVAYPNILYIQSGKTLTIDSGASLVNQGQIENYGALVNNGSLINSYAELRHHFPTATYSGNSLNSGDLYFSGTLPVGDTDVGVFSTGIVDQVKQGDTLTIANGSSLTIPSGHRFVNDGTLIVNYGGTVNNNDRFENNDTVQISGDIISTNALTNSLGAQLKILGSTATLQINSGTLINLGTIENQGTFQNNATINNGFTIGNSNDNAPNTLIDNQGSLINNGTIHNGNHNGSGSIETVGAIENYSTINNQGGSIIINQQYPAKRGSLTLYNASTVTNNGTLTLNAGGDMALNSGSTINNYLTFEVFSNLSINSGSEITNHSDATLSTSDGAGRIINNGGIINNNDSSTMTLAPNTSILNSGSIINNASFTSRGKIENDGRGLFENNNYFYNIGLITNVSTIINNGDFGSTTAFQNNYNGHIINYGGVITNNSTGTFTLNTFDNYAQFINYGTLSLLRDIIQYDGSELALLSGEASNYGLFENKTGATISFTEGLFTNIGSLENYGVIADSTASSLAFTNNGELTNWACDGGVLDAQVSGTDTINNCKLVAIYASNSTNTACDLTGTWNAAKSRCEGTIFHIKDTTCSNMNGQWNNTTKNCNVDSFLSEANIIVNIPEGNTLTINGTATIEGSFFGLGKLVNYGTINTDGPMTLTGSIPSENNGTFNNNGVMEVWGPASFNNVGNLNNLSTGEVVLKTDGVFNNTGNFTNEGLLSLDGINITDNTTETSPGVFKIIVTDSLQSTVARFNNNSYGKFVNENTGQIIIRDDGIFFNKANSDFKNYGVLDILDDVENKDLHFDIDDLINEEVLDEGEFYDGYRDPLRIATFINTGVFTQYGGASITNYDQLLVATDGLLNIEGGTFTNHGEFKIYKEATVYTRINAVILNQVDGFIENLGNLFSESTIDNYGEFFSDAGSFFENLFSFSFHNKAGGIFTNAGTVRNTGGFFDNQTGSVFINLKGFFENGDGTLSNEINATVVNTGTIDVGTGSFINDGDTNNFNGASILGVINGIPAQQINNAPPISDNQEIKLQINTIVEIFPSATDEEGQALTYSFVGSPINGRLISGQGHYFYAPNLGFVGEDSLSFIASDGITDSNVGEINIAVSINNAPNAVAQSLTLAEDGSLAITLSGTDVDGIVESFAIVSNPSQGILTGTVPNLTYVPNANYFGSDSFTFTVTDNDAQTSVNETIDITVTDVNDAATGQPIILGTLLRNETLSIDTSAIADNDGLDTFNYQWKRSGLAVGSNADTYLLGTDNVGQSVSVVVYFTDQGGYNEAVQSGITATVSDLDSDNDGIFDLDEGTGDFDGDGTPNYLDDDSDGDGILDIDEGTVDSDADGIKDYLDISLDEDGDGIPDKLEGTLNSDTDNDGINDAFDTDSDNDGISDFDESGATDLDTDNDGIDDAFDVDNTGGTDANGDGIDDDVVPLDTDNDGIPNYVDRDSDNDSVPDILENKVGLALKQSARSYKNTIKILPLIPMSDIDIDGDGLLNYVDPDSDNDGISDLAEAATIYIDSDMDQIIDEFDVDFTGGVDANLDGVDDAALLHNSDNDTTPDMFDLDSDNDGHNDVVEAGLSDIDMNALVDSSAERTDDPMDTDLDTLADYRDLDSNDDGIFDIVTSGAATLDIDGDGQIDDASIDSDKDGIIDSMDSEPNHFGTKLDRDNDGVPSSIDLDDDGDGISDQVEGVIDSDNDGIINSLDSDSDNDGLSDSFESDRPAPLGVDIDRDGIDDQYDIDFTGGSDSDMDGVDDIFNTVDTDSDGFPDYLDTDSDNDGISDTEEQLTVPLMNSDTDLDGIDDAVDVDQTAGVDQNNNGQDDSTISNTDLDGDDVLAYRDSDTDGDGILDSSENGDFNNDGINDRLQVPVEVKATSGGSFSTGIVMMLSIVALCRRRKLLKKTVLIALSLIPFTLSAETGDKKKWWYAGLSLGQASFEPQTAMTNWKTDDNTDSSKKVLIGYNINQDWFAEFGYGQLGNAELISLNPSLQNNGSIDYDVTELLAGYHFTPSGSNFNFSVKAGWANLKTSSNFISSNNKDVTVLGAGVSWNTGYNLSLGATFEKYGDAIEVFSLNIYKNF